MVYFLLSDNLSESKFGTGTKRVSALHHHLTPARGIRRYAMGAWESIPARARIKSGLRFFKKLVTGSNEDSGKWRFDGIPRPYCFDLLNFRKYSATASE